MSTTNTFFGPLTVVTVFLGIRLKHVGLNDSALYAMIVYCVGVALVIVFDVYLSLKGRNHKASFSPAGEVKEGEFTIMSSFAVVVPAGEGRGGRMSSR